MTNPDKMAEELASTKRERDELHRLLCHISRTYCGIEIGKPLEGIEEPETDVWMVPAFVEGAIDKQAYRADKAEDERDSLKQQLESLHLKELLACVEGLRSVLLSVNPNEKKQPTLFVACEIAANSLAALDKLTNAKQERK